MRSVAAVALIATLVLAPTAVASGSHAELVVRVAGANRSATAAEVSEYGGAAETVVVARSDDFPDSLAVAPLAAALNAPVLLTPTSYANSETIGEIERLGATRVVIAGGQHALSSETEAMIRALGATTERISGSSRYATAGFIAESVYTASGTPLDDRVAYLALGGRPAAWEAGTPVNGWPDAVSGGALAAASGAPLLLTDGLVLPRDTVEAIGALGIRRVIVVGGEAAVAPQVVNDLEQLGVTVERVAGSDRYETAYLSASHAVEAGADPSTTIFATGRQWPDAVTGGALAGRVSAPMVLLDGRQFDARPAAGAFVDRFGVQHGIVLGGETAVAATTVDALANRIMQAQTP